MCVTDKEEYADACRYFKNLCFPLKGSRNYIHEDIGFNYRMSNLHAAIGLAQTEKADEYRNARINNNSLYKKYLNDVPGIIFQEDTKDSLNVHWMNAIVVDREMYGHTRDELMAYLKENQIDTRLLFVSMNRQPSLKKYGCDCEGIYEVTDWLSENGLYLPSSSKLDEEIIKGICDLIRDFAK